MTLFFVLELISCCTGIHLKSNPTIKENPLDGWETRSNIYIFTFALFSCLFLSFRRWHTCVTRKTGAWVFPSDSLPANYFVHFPSRICLAIRSRHWDYTQDSWSPAAAPSSWMKQENPACLCYLEKEFICGNQLAWWQVNISCSRDILPVL